MQASSLFRETEKCSFASFQIDGICGRTIGPGILPGQSSYVHAYNLGHKFENMTSNGMEWACKMPFVGVFPYHSKTCLDGLNVQGLAVTMLALKWNNQTESCDARVLFTRHIALWIIGNCASLSDVKAALPNINDWVKEDKETRMHVAIYDPNGSGLLEVSHGKADFYDSPAGIFTNDSNFPWNDAASTPHGQKCLERLSTASNKILSSKSNSVTPKFDSELRQIRYLMKDEDQLKLSDGTSTLEQIHFLRSFWSTIKNLNSRIFYFKPAFEKRYQAIYLFSVNFKADIKHPEIQIKEYDKEPHPKEKILTITI